ncbi:hypothetical protein KSS87_006449 [Heliosperma pusillum]|nr:hypothetical protein KSS87_006449 [Heliosperma pusillum]
MVVSIPCFDRRFIFRPTDAHILLCSRYSISSSVQGQASKEYMVLLDLIKKGHSEPDKKIGSGLNAFEISYHPTFQSRCLFVIRDDQSVEDFSSINSIRLLGVLNMRFMFWRILATTVADGYACEGHTGSVKDPRSDGEVADNDRGADTGDAATNGEVEGVAQPLEVGARDVSQWWLAVNKSGFVVDRS